MHVTSHSPRSQANKGSEFAGGLCHFGAGFSVQGLTDEVPGFEELLEVHTLEEIS